MVMFPSSESCTCGLHALTNAVPLCAAAPAPAPTGIKTFPALAGTNPSTAVAPTGPNLAGTTAVAPANQGIVAAKAPTTSASGRRSLA